MMRYDVCILCVVVLALLVWDTGSAPSGALWRKLSDKEKQQWYAPNDLCVVASTRNDTFEAIAKGCDEESRLRGEALKQTRCRAGNSWPSKSGFCAPFDYQFSERKSLQEAVKGFDDPLKKPMASFFRKLAKENGALLIAGDSVMQQFYSAMACELERENVWKDPSKFTNTDEVQYVRDPSVSNSNRNWNSSSSSGGSGGSGGSGSSDGVSGGSKETEQSHKVPIHFLNIYHFVNGRYDRVPDAALRKLKDSVEQLSAKHSSLVVLFNVGLHYVDNPVAHFTRADYSTQLTTVLRWLHQYAVKHTSKTVRIFWRETSAQHFPTSNGYWPGSRYANSMHLQCVPVNDSSASADWRNRDVEAIIRGQNLFRVTSLPFYNITQSLHSGHPGGHMRDCTHLCWSPLLYQPLFHSLDNAMSAPIRSA